MQSVVVLTQFTLEYEQRRFHLRSHVYLKFIFNSYAQFNTHLINNILGNYFKDIRQFGPLNNPDCAKVPGVRRNQYGSLMFVTKNICLTSSFSYCPSLSALTWFGLNEIKTKLSLFFDLSFISISIANFKFTNGMKFFA